MIHFSKFLTWRPLAAHGADWSVHAQRIFLGFVAFCLVARLALTLYPVFGKTIVSPLEERRASHPFPSVQLLTATNGDFAAGLNKWFDDRVGLRDLFIRAKNQIDYTLFHTSKKVYVGACSRPTVSIPSSISASLERFCGSKLPLTRWGH